MTKNSRRCGGGCDRTLHSCFRASCRQQTHRADHEILEDSIGDLRIARSVFLETGDLVDIDGATGVFEGRVEARSRRSLHGIGLMSSLGCIGSYDGGRGGGGDSG